MSDVIYIAVLAVAYFAVKAMPQDVMVRLTMGVLGSRGLEKVGRTALASQPDRITLDPNPRPPSQDQAVNAVRALERRGFQAAGSFSVREMGGMVVHLMTKATDAAVAVVYEHTRAGVWSDVASRYVGGGSFTVTSARAGSSLQERPGHATVRAPGQPAAMLHVRLLNERPAGELERVEPADAGAHFVAAYAEATAWRKRRGITAAEVRGAALERIDSGETLSASAGVPQDLPAAAGR